MNHSININAKYTLIAKESYGGVINNYTVVDDKGKQLRLGKDKFIEVVKNNNVTNCIYAQGILKGIGISLREIPEYDLKTGNNTNGGMETDVINRINALKTESMLEVTARLMHGRDCIGYVLKNHLGTENRFKRDDVILMIKAGFIPSVTYQYYNGNHFIKGIGYNISKLPTINVDESMCDCRYLTEEKIDENDKDKTNEAVQADFEVTERILSGRKCIGYRLRNLETCDEQIYDRETVLKFGEDKKIKGIAVYNNNGHKMIQGNGINLKNIKVSAVESLERIG